MISKLYINEDYYFEALLSKGIIGILLGGHYNMLYTSWSKLNTSVSITDHGL